jgi:hypothetical protein
VVTAGEGLAGPGRHDGGTASHDDATADHPVTLIRAR